MSRRQLRHNLHLNQRGAVVIEFAVVVLLLLLILFGIMEFSFTFLQRHFVANAAREGVRIGVRAQNYNCFDKYGSASCPTTNRVDRGATVINQLTDCDNGGYLCTLYKNDIATTTDNVTPERIINPDGTKTLTVTVTVPNFFPTLISGLVPGYQHPTTITYSASGNYENADEP
ncbi:MAG: pilus assembly protein [Desulfuromonadales bacterium]|nr:pilus assembly protein [Desulfuromonadales bacterium]